MKHLRLYVAELFLQLMASFDDCLVVSVANCLEKHREGENKIE